MHDVTTNATLARALAYADGARDLDTHPNAGPAWDRLAADMGAPDPVQAAIDLQARWAINEWDGGM